MHFSASTFTVPYLHKYFAVVQKMLFGHTPLFLVPANLKSKLKNYEKTAISNNDIWDKFSEQHQHQNTEKGPYLIPN